MNDFLPPGYSSYADPQHIYDGPSGYVKKDAPRDLTPEEKKKREEILNRLKARAK